MAGFGLHEGEEEVSKRQKLPVTEQETGKLRKPQSWGSGTRLPKTETQSKRTRNLLLPSKILHQVISKSCLPLAKGPEHKERFPLWCMHARMRRRMLCLVFECKFIDHHSSTSSPLITSNVEIKYQKNPILHTGQLNTYSRISQTLLFKIFTCALDRKKEESNFGYIWQMLSNINCLLVTNNDN